MHSNGYDPCRGTAWRHNLALPLRAYLFIASDQGLLVLSRTLLPDIGVFRTLEHGGRLVDPCPISNRAPATGN